MSKSFASIGCAVIVLMALPLPLYGQNQSLFDLSLEQLLSVRIVGATLQPETLLSVPSAVTVFDRGQWQRMGITRLEELMNFVPGYQAYRGGGAAVQWQFSSRGRRTGYASREILILVDGIRLNEDWAGGAFYSAGLSLENAERVEFIRGPGSAIYGANAFLGVINITTIGRRELTAELGGDGYRRLAAHWRNQSGAVDLSLHFEHQNDDGQTLLAFNPDPSRRIEERTRDGYRVDSAALTAKVGDFSLRARYAESEEDEFYTVGRLVQDKQLDSRRRELQLNYQSQLNEDWQANIKAEWADRNQTSLGIIDIATQTLSLARFKEREITVASSFNYQFNPEARAVFGFEWRQPEHLQAELTLSGPVDLTLPLARMDTRNITGVFVQWQQDVRTDWQLTTGLRFDHFSDFGSNVSPRIGLIYKQDSQNSFKILYGAALQAPSWLELYGNNNAVVLGNSDLKPEVEKTGELIWSHVGNKFQFQASVFYIRLDDAIRIDPLSITFVNTKTETISGLEFEIRRTLNPYWQLLGTGSWISNEATKFNTEADLLGSISLQYKRQRFSMGLQAHYQGERDNANASAAAIPGQIPKALGSRVPLSVNLQYRIAQHYEAYFSIHNLLDNDSLSAANSVDNPIGIPNRGRELRAGLRWNF